MHVKERVVQCDITYFCSHNRCVALAILINKRGFCFIKYFAQIYRKLSVFLKTFSVFTCHRRLHVLTIESNYDGN